MNSGTETLDAVRAALAITPRLDLQAQPIDLAIGAGSLTMTDEVASRRQVDGPIQITAPL